MSMRKGLPAACIAAACVWSATARADISDEHRRWFATVYAGTMAETRLASIPEGLVSGSMDYENAHMVFGALSYVVLPDIRIDGALAPVVNGTSLELEGLVGHHFGDQDHVELAFSVFWRSPDIALPGGANVNFAIGEGLSLALSRPELEGVRRGAEAHKLLNYLAFEAEFSHDALPGVSLVPRIHHRSGIYGVIAPRHTGSNFLGAGLRINLQ